MLLLRIALYVDRFLRRMSYCDEFNGVARIFVWEGLPMPPGRFSVKPTKFGGGGG